MPIREACHVALQRVHPSKHRLWKHAEARQNDKGRNPTAVLQIVCLRTCKISKYYFQLTLTTIDWSLYNYEA